VVDTGVGWTTQSHSGVSGGASNVCGSSSSLFNDAFPVTDYVASNERISE
jgi:hypothetical protein